MDYRTKQGCLSYIFLGLKDEKEGGYPGEGRENVVLLCQYHSHDCVKAVASKRTGIGCPTDNYPFPNGCLLIGRVPVTIPKNNSEKAGFTTREYNAVRYECEGRGVMIMEGED